MTDAQIETGCYVVAALCGLALVLMHDPNSFLSRLFDRLDGDDTTNRKALR